MLVGTGLWVIALATPYWLIHVPGAEQPDTPPSTATTPSSFINRKVIWAHSGIWRKCELVELYHSNYGEPDATLQCNPTLDTASISDVRRWRWECWTLSRLPGPASELAVAGAGALVSVAACVLSWHALRHPHHTYR